MYQLEASKIKLSLPPKNEQEGVDVPDPLQASFIYCLIGKPGSGKTFLIQTFLLDRQFYWKKFDSVIFLTPPGLEKLELTEKNWNSQFDVDWIYTKIDELNNKQFNRPQLLIIIDDFIDQLNVNRNNPKLLNILFNRRHLLKNKGTISIIITSQKYKLIPTCIRSNYTGLFLFKLNGEEWKYIKEDNIYGNYRQWDNIISDIFESDENGRRPFLYINKTTDQVYRNFEKIIINKT